LKISVNGIEIPARGKPITDSNRVDDIVRKFRSKYGEGDVKKYYSKLDVAVGVPGNLLYYKTSTNVLNLLTR
jgi:hypothetical protein